jgi:hypothetical protein
MEWLILCLGVPAIVVPVVLLWGYVGCDLVFLPTDPKPMTPIGLVATPLTPTSVALAWAQSTDTHPIKLAVERLDPGAADFVRLVDDLTEPAFEDTGLTEGATFIYRVVAVGRDEDSDPSKTVQVDLSFKTVFERTAAEFAQGVNQTGIAGFCLVERFLRAPISPRLLRGGTVVKITVRGSTVADLQIDGVFISRANPDPTAKPNDSDADDLTLVAQSAFVPANTAVVVGPTGLTLNGTRVYTLDPTQDLIVAFAIGTPGNPRFGALAPATASTSYAKANAAIEASMPTRTKEDSSAAILHLIEKIEVLEIARAEG